MDHLLGGGGQRIVSQDLQDGLDLAVRLHQAHGRIVLGIASHVQDGFLLPGVEDRQVGGHHRFADAPLAVDGDLERFGHGSIQGYSRAPIGASSSSPKRSA
jgi:hypothetical protein